MKTTGNYVVYIIERKQGRERTFGPITDWGAFSTKRDAMNMIRRCRAAYPDAEYRVTSYWDKRHW